MSTPFSTPSRPAAPKAHRRATASIDSTLSGSHGPLAAGLSVSGFTPGGPVPAGFSYLENASGAAIRTPTRRGDVTASKDGPSRGKIPQSRSHNTGLGRSETRPRVTSRAADRIAAALSTPDSIGLKRSKTSSAVSVRSAHQADSSTWARPSCDLSSLDNSLTSLASLPTDPRSWLPGHVALYLTHILQLVPSPVVEDLTAFVKNERMSGKAFLRLKEKDLAEKGMNTRWRRLMSEASHRLRREALRRRIWNNESDSARKWEQGLDEEGGDESQTESSYLSPGQQRMMTATLKRIRDRRYVKGLIEALESPKLDNNERLPSPNQSPPGRVTHTRRDSDSSVEREPILPPFGDGYVKRQASSFSNLASSADEVGSWRGHRRGGVRGATNNSGASSLDLSGETSYSLTSSNSATSISTSATSEMDTDENVMSLSSWAHSPGSKRKAENVPEEMSKEDSNAEDDSEPAWDTPLDQTLIDLIFSSSSDFSSSASEDDRDELDSGRLSPATSTSSSFAAVAEKAYKESPERPSAKIDVECTGGYEDESGTLKNTTPWEAPSVRGLFDAWDTPAEPPSQPVDSGLRLDLNPIKVATSDASAFEVPEPGPPALRLHIATESAQGTLRAKTQSKATATFGRSRGKQATKSLGSLFDLPAEAIKPDAEQDNALDRAAGASVDLDAGTGTAKEGVEHVVKEPSSSTCLAAVPPESDLPPLSTEIDDHGNDDLVVDPEELAELDIENIVTADDSPRSDEEAKNMAINSEESSKRTLSRAVARSGYLSVLQALDVARAGVEAESEVDLNASEAKSATTLPTLDALQQRNCEEDLASQSDRDTADADEKNNTTPEEACQAAADNSDVSIEQLRALEVWPARVNPWSGDLIAEEGESGPIADRMILAPSTVKDVSGLGWPDCPVDAEFEALAAMPPSNNTVAGSLRNSSFGWLAAAIQPLRQALNDPLAVTGVPATEVFPSPESPQSATDREDRGDGDIAARKAGFGLPSSWSKLPPYVLGLGAGIAVVVVSELLLRGGARGRR